MPRILWDRDIIAGSMFVLLGAAALWYAHHYALGRLNDMGPGFFPLICAVLLTFFGLVALLEALTSKTRVSVPAVAPRPFIAITAAVCVFALLLDRIGLPATVFVSSLVASAARPRFLVPSNFVLAALLAVTSVIVFVQLLAIPMRVLPAVLQGY